MNTSDHSNGIWHLHILKNCDNLLAFCHLDRGQIGLLDYCYQITSLIMHALWDKLSRSCHQCDWFEICTHAHYQWFGWFGQKIKYKRKGKIWNCIHTVSKSSTHNEPLHAEGLGSRLPSKLRPDLQSPRIIFSMLPKLIFNAPWINFCCLPAPSRTFVLLPI